MRNENEPIIRLGRRAFLYHGTLLLTAATLDVAPLCADEQKLLRVGLVTDLHHADKPPAGSRHYRESQKKLAEAGEHFQQSKADFIVELGDLIDAADSVDTEQKYLTTINRLFSAISKYFCCILNDVLHSKLALEILNKWYYLLSQAGAKTKCNILS